MILDFSKPIYVLAPLAGFTDLPFRSVVKKLGVDLTVSEMISSNALVYRNEKTLKMLEKSILETPYSVQIAGSNSNILKNAVEVLNEYDGIDIIDLNCGCPAPKVTNNLSGSALLTDLKKMGDSIKMIKKTSKKKYTSVKIRLGFNEKIHTEIAKVCEDNGADFISVHGRTRSGKFKSEVDYKAIKEIKERVSIPVIANGDITTIEKSKYVLEYTNSDGIMIGRGAIGNPWIFYQIKHNIQNIDSKLIKDIIIFHFNEMIKFYGEKGVILFRKHLHSYSKLGYKNATIFRNKINYTQNIQEVRELINSFFSE